MRTITDRTNNSDRFVPAEPIHPGEYIRDELEAREWAQEDLAMVMGISLRHLANLIAGRSGVTPDLAVKLAQAFEQSPETWMNLQVSFELAHAAKEDRSIARRAAVYLRYPVRAMQRRGWIPETSDAEELVRNTCRFLCIDRIDDKPKFPVAARKSVEDNGAHIAWYCRAREMSEHVSAAEYREQQFSSLIDALRKFLPNRADVRRVPRTLADFGIRLVLVEHLPKTRLDGAAFFHRGYPVVALSLRYDRIDNFWFTLFHELMHIKHRDEVLFDIDVGNSGADLPEFEQRANAEAADALISKVKIESFIARARPQYYQARIVQFAQARGVHPAIVVGQLQHRREIEYTHFKKLLEPIRELIVGQALTDGWGNRPTAKLESEK